MVATGEGWGQVKHTLVAYCFFILSHSLWVKLVKFSYLATPFGSFLLKFDNPVGIKFQPADTPIGVKIHPAGLYSPMDEILNFYTVHNRRVPPMRMPRLVANQREVKLSNKRNCALLKSKYIWNQRRHGLWPAPPTHRVCHVKMQEPGGRLNKKDGLTRYGDSHVKDKTS